MPFVLMLSFVLIGVAACAAALVALLLPMGRAIQVGLTLVLGAGVGVVVLAIGAFAMSGSSPKGEQNVFLVASVCGFSAVVTGLWLVWQRQRRRATRRVAIGRHAERVVQIQEGEHLSLRRLVLREELLKRANAVGARKADDLGDDRAPKVACALLHEPATLRGF